jgi:dihydroorotate dehydrogenase
MVTDYGQDTLEPGPVVRWKPVSLSTGKRDLVLDPPLTNASGILGFSTEAASLIDFSRLGGFITNPISLGKRDPAGGSRFVPTPGGFVLHTGLPNPGLRSCIRRYRQRWRAMACPVILHLIADRPEDMTRMVEWLEPLEEIAGVEVGLQDEQPAAVSRLVGAAASRELPVLARVPFTAPVASIWAALDAGAAGISLAPPRAALPGPAGISGRGRLYGPAVFPLALETITGIRANGVEAPLFAAGGIYRRDQMEAMLSAGASGVQLDGALWTEPEALLSVGDDD